MTKFWRLEVDISPPVKAAASQAQAVVGCGEVEQGGVEWNEMQ